MGITSKISKKTILKYNDARSTLCLWWKAMFLAPPWAMLLIPFYGGIFLLFGDVFAQFGFTILLALLLIYFVNDLKKRNITIEGNTLYFGFEKFDLNQLESAGLTYKKNQVLPKALVLNFSSGKRLNLALSRLSSFDFEALIEIINSHPNCKIDPVIATLTKCKHIARPILIDQSDKLEIVYDSHKFFKELFGSFIHTANEWTRVGPILAFFANVELVETLIPKQALEKFEKEAQILKQLQNKQIVKLIDYFVEDHRGYKAC